MKLNTYNTYQQYYQKAYDRQRRCLRKKTHTSFSGKFANRLVICIGECKLKQAYYIHRFNLLSSKVRLVDYLTAESRYNLHYLYKSFSKQTA